MTKYPIILVHGIALREMKYFKAFGRIESTLTDAGYKTYTAKTDAFGSIESNAEQLREIVLDVLCDSGAEKVNIIAHSKGGLDSRYAISRLGMAEKVASLTTLSTPHHGSVTVDRLLAAVPDCLVKIGCAFADGWFSLLGDKDPNTYNAINSFKTEEAKKFNTEVKDSERTYYRSYAFVMKKARFAVANLA